MISSLLIILGHELFAYMEKVSIPYFCPDPDSSLTSGLRNDENLTPVKENSAAKRCSG